MRVLDVDRRFHELLDWLIRSDPVLADACDEFLPDDPTLRERFYGRSMEEFLVGIQYPGSASPAVERAK